MWYHKSRESKDKSCKICGENFYNNHALKLHTEKHTNETLLCKFCNKTFYNPARYEKHQNSHDPNMPYNCSGCKKKFENKSDMKKCQLSHGVEKFPCTICKLEFKSKFSLAGHKMIHSGERPHSCKTCKKSFRYKRTLKLHMMDHEGRDSWPYECETCHEKFKTSERLKYHKYTHTGGSAFECTICGMGYSDQRRLEDHLLLHNLKEGTCKVCSKLFNDKEQFVSHGIEHPPVDLNDSQYRAMLHTQDQQFTPAAFFNSKGYMCHVCDFIFPSKMLLKYHLPDHAADKPFMCMLCKKQLSSRKTMKAHMLLHVSHNQKCSVCHRSFLTNSDLVRHMKTHFPSKSWKKFQCEICGKYLMTSHGLAIHQEKYCISFLEGKEPETSTEPEKTTETETSSSEQFRCGWCHATFGDEEKHKVGQKYRYGCIFLRNFSQQIYELHHEKTCV